MNKLLKNVEGYRSGHKYRRLGPANVCGWIGKDSWLQFFPNITSLARIEREAKRLAVKHDSEITSARIRKDVPLDRCLAAIEARFDELETYTRGNQTNA